MEITRKDIITDNELRDQPRRKLSSERERERAWVAKGNVGHLQLFCPSSCLLRVQSVIALTIDQNEGSGC